MLLHLFDWSTQCLVTKFSHCVATTVESDSAACIASSTSFIDSLVFIEMNKKAVCRSAIGSLNTALALMHCHNVAIMFHF